MIWHWIYTVPLRLRSIFRRSQVELELEEELCFHLEARMRQEIAGGATPEEARYAALRAMDGMEQRKEECRHMRHINLVDNLVRDTRHAVRTLARSPGFTLAALLTLALGIATSTAVFSVVNGILLRPLPYREPERLVWIQDGLTQSTRSSRWGASVADFLLWQSRGRSFDPLAAWAVNTFNITSGTGILRICRSVLLAADVPGGANQRARAPLAPCSRVRDSGHRSQRTRRRCPLDGGGVARIRGAAAVPHDSTAAFVGAALVLGVVAIVGSLIPAWRAARIDPVIALRQE